MILLELSEHSYKLQNIDETRIITCLMAGQNPAILNYDSASNRRFDDIFHLFTAPYVFLNDRYGVRLCFEIMDSIQYHASFMTLFTIADFKLRKESRFYIDFDNMSARKKNIFPLMIVLEMADDIIDAMGKNKIFSLQVSQDGTVLKEE